MAKDRVAGDEKGAAGRHVSAPAATLRRASPGEGAASAWLSLLPRLGNRAVQRLLAQRSGDEPAELDDETANRINRERGGGQALDAGVAAQAGAALGHDFSGVRVHTSPEADSLSRALGAKAFTTGRDVFFRAGAYEPHSASGRELLGHELTHVAQQGGGASAGRMTVNPPGDAYEQEANQAAKALLGSTPASLQRQEPEPEEDQEEKVQTQEDEEEQVP